MTKSETDIIDVSKTVLTLATGALALTVTFRHDLAPQDASAVWLLKISWAFFLLCIVFHLVEMIMEAARVRDMAGSEELKEIAEGNLKEFNRLIKEKKLEESLTVFDQWNELSTKAIAMSIDTIPMLRLAAVLRGFSFLALLVGFVLFFVFAVLNT